MSKLSGTAGEPPSVAAGLDAVEARARHIRVGDAEASIPGPAGARFRELFEHGTLSIEYYAPRGTDPQQPHDRDEVYVIARGAGDFVYGTQRVRFASGDLLFVPAYLPHRFVDFSADFGAWVMFYGPVGGERPG